MRRPGNSTRAPRAAWRLGRLRASPSAARRPAGPRALGPPSAAAEPCVRRGRGARRVTLRWRSSLPGRAPLARLKTAPSEEHLAFWRCGSSGSRAPRLSLPRPPCPGSQPWSNKDAAVPLTPKKLCWKTRAGCGVDVSAIFVFCLYVPEKKPRR